VEKRILLREDHEPLCLFRFYFEGNFDIWTHGKEKLKVSEFATETEIEISGHFSSVSFTQKITPSVVEYTGSPFTSTFI
jgi:hypothetical protein